MQAKKVDDADNDAPSTSAGADGEWRGGKKMVGMEKFVQLHRIAKFEAGERPDDAGTVPFLFFPDPRFCTPEGTPGMRNGRSLVEFQGWWATNPLQYFRVAEGDILSVFWQLPPNERKACVLSKGYADYLKPRWSGFVLIVIIRCV